MLIIQTMTGCVLCPTEFYFFVKDSSGCFTYIQMNGSMLTVNLPALKQPVSPSSHLFVSCILVSVYVNMLTAACF